jgi:hypothetical protein
MCQNSKQGMKQAGRVDAVGARPAHPRPYQYMMNCRIIMEDFNPQYSKLPWSSYHHWPHNETDDEARKRSDITPGED